MSEMLPTGANASGSEPAAAPKVTVRHYQALCGLALAAILLLQVQQTGQAVLNASILVFVHAIVLLIGAVSVLYRIRLSPVFFLLALGLPMAIEQFYASQLFNVQTRGFRMLDIGDMLLCMAGLVFFIGLYRLQGLRFGVSPSAGGDTTRNGPPARRSEESMTPGEFLPLILIVPTLALLSELLWAMLHQTWTPIDLPPRWRQLVFVAWMVFLAMFLAAHAFRYWRRLQMDRATALLMLQDLLWEETRGEQRRIWRWLAWRKKKTN